MESVFLGLLGIPTPKRRETRLICYPSGGVEKHIPNIWDILLLRIPAFKDRPPNLLRRCHSRWHQQSLMAQTGAGGAGVLCAYAHCTYTDRVITMAQPGHQFPAGVPYGSGPPNNSSIAGGVMLPNGQPVRPSGFMPPPHMQSPRLPGNQQQQSAPPVNGVSHPPQVGQQPIQQQPQSFSPQHFGPPKTASPFHQQHQPGAPPSYQNGPQSSASQPPPNMPPQLNKPPQYPPHNSPIPPSSNPPSGAMPPYQQAAVRAQYSPSAMRPQAVTGQLQPPPMASQQPIQSPPMISQQPLQSPPMVSQQPMQSPPMVSQQPMQTPHMVSQQPMQSPPMLSQQPMQSPPMASQQLMQAPSGASQPPLHQSPLALKQPMQPPPITPQQQQQQHLPPTSMAQPPGVHTMPPQQQHQQQPQMAGMPPRRPHFVQPQQQQQQATNLSNRYPPQPSYGQPRYPGMQPGMSSSNINNTDNLTSQMGSLSVTQMGFSKLWGMDTYDLMQMRNILPPEKVQPPKVNLHQNLMESANCSTDIFRCTLTKIPESSSLLQKSRLPLGILIHPFKDLSQQLPVIQCNTIVRCRACRTYINPFVYFVDHKLPEEFQYDPVSKTYGDPSRRPEIKSAATESGYLNVVCETLLEELDRLPGDSRTQIGFLTFDSTLHFYSLNESLSQPHMMIVSDVDDVFLPYPDNLLVNLQESRQLVRDLLSQLPSKFVCTYETGSALGAALQASLKLMAAMGGRVTVFQVSLPSSGPGSLQSRGPGNAKDSSPLLNPATDFYKRLALDCSGQQIAVDLFLLNSQYADLATLSGISRFSGGCVHHFPDFNGAVALHKESLERSFRRYLTRKIGFEAVMRVRCTRGLAIHTFHGNFFVRSTDLLSLPNVNPDAGFGMQLSIEESLSDVQNVCFQAALLYTSSKGERRIRVHTLCLPIAANVSDVLNGADQQCIVGLLAKMAADRSQLSSLSDARDAFINVAVDVLSTYRVTQSTGPSSGLLAPHSLRLLPLYIVALLKHPAFRSGQNVRVDDRLFAMCQMKSLPLDALMQCIYPDMYPLHCLTDEGAIEVNGQAIPQPPRLHLSAEKLDTRGLFLLDSGPHMLIYAGRNIAPELCQAVLGVSAFEAIPDNMMDLPELENPESQRLRAFVNHLQSEKPYPPTLQVIREDSKHRSRFVMSLLEDRSESALSYYEFLQHLKTQVK
ncbi:hypothetical protein B566_EDAN009585 [Ephemera danica]|nr:hypothetical protein B566_EDAN009585 [Ephemera danica]